MHAGRFAQDLLHVAARGQARQDVFRHASQLARRQDPSAGIFPGLRLRSHRPVNDGQPDRQLFAHVRIRDARAQHASSGGPVVLEEHLGVAPQRVDLVLPERASRRDQGLHLQDRRDLLEDVRQGSARRVLALGVGVDDDQRLGMDADHGHGVTFRRGDLGEADRAVAACVGYSLGNLLQPPAQRRLLVMVE